MYFLVPLASSSTATLCGSTATPSGSIMRTSGSTAPAILLAFFLLAVVFQRGTTALVVVPLLGAVVLLYAGCEHNDWIFFPPKRESSSPMNLISLARVLPPLLTFFELANSQSLQ